MHQSYQGALKKHQYWRSVGDPDRSPWSRLAQGREREAPGNPNRFRPSPIRGQRRGPPQKRGKLSQAEGAQNLEVDEHPRLIRISSQASRTAALKLSLGGPSEKEGEETEEVEEKGSRQTAKLPPHHHCSLCVSRGFLKTCIFCLNGCGTKGSCVSGRRGSFVLCGEAVRCHRERPKEARGPRARKYEVSIQSKVCEVIHSRQQVETAQGSINW